MNSKVNFFGSIVSIDKTKDTTEMQAVRAKYTALFKKVLREHPEDKIKDKDTYFNVLDEAFTGMLPKLDASVTDIEQLAPFFNEIKEIVAGLDGAIREILFGTYQDDLFLFSTMVFRFLQQKPAEFSVGRELLVRRIFKWFPADQYSELYQEEKATPPAVVTTTQTTVPDNGESARVQEQQAAASIGAGEPEVVANQPQPKEKEKRTDTPHQVTSALAVAAKAAGRRGQPTTSTTHTVPHGQDTLPALPERNLTPLPQQLEKPEDGDDSKKGPPPLPARNADTSTTTTTTTSTDSNPDMEAARANVEKPGMGSNLLADIQKGTTLMPKEERDAKLQAAAERKKAAGKLSSSNGKEAKSMQDVIAEAMLARRDKLEEEKQKKLTPEQQAANGGRASPNEWVDEDPDDDQGSSEKPGPGQRT